MNVLLIIIAAILSFIIGGVWFSPKIFYTRFFNEMDLKEELVEKNKKNFNPLITFGLTFLGEVLTATILMILLKTSSLNSFVVVILVALCVNFSNIKTNLFSFSNPVIYFITEGQKFVSIVVMGLVLIIFG